MPNWCDNSMRLSHQDKDKIDALQAELEKKNDDGHFMAEVFQHLCPRPADQEDNWYDWNISNWGTKWDASLIDWDRSDDNTITIYCDTAWSPPTALYQYLYNNGWEVEAYYHEGGCAFAGIWSDGDDDYYEYDVTDKESIENLPSDLVDFAGLENAHEEWMENEREERLRDLPRTEWYDGSMKPARKGSYEINTADRSWDHYAEWNGEDWGFNWDGEPIVPTRWRGLITEFTPADEQAILDDIIENS